MKKTYKEVCLDIVMKIITDISIGGSLVAEDPEDGVHLFRSIRRIINHRQKEYNKLLKEVQNGRDKN